ncbi:MAG: 50S ribosomal protein L31 [Chloroflexi bacterium]|nr:50S ribosomal protein L31 [Chloroflexota bacterium]
MKSDIHPKYYPDAKVTCACGNVFTTGSTKPELRTDVCSVCHPFFTGEQRIVDTAGQVDRFIRRLERKTALVDEAEKQAAETKKSRTKRPKAIALVDEGAANQE